MHPRLLYPVICWRTSEFNCMSSCCRYTTIHFRGASVFSVLVSSRVSSANLVVAGHQRERFYSEALPSNEWRKGIMRLEILVFFKLSTSYKDVYTLLEIFFKCSCLSLIWTDQSVYVDVEKPRRWERNRRWYSMKDSVIKIVDLELPYQYSFQQINYMRKEIRDRRRID